MNKKVYDALIEALPTYNQIRGDLIRLGEGGKPEGHCFMGVLYDLAVKAGVASWGDYGLARDWKQVWEWAQISGDRFSSYNGFYLLDEESGRRMEAYNLNDGGYSFERLVEALKNTPYDEI